MHAVHARGPRLRTPPHDGRTLFGREAELARLTRVVDSAASGAGSIALIVGEPGCGKSALVDAITSAALHRGVEVVVGRADPYGLPLAALRDALGSGTVAPACGPELDTATAPDDPVGWSRVVVVDRVLSRVEVLAATRPLLVVVEDLHFADDITLAALGALSRRVGQLGCGLVATTRPWLPSAEAQRCVDALADAGALPVRPGPLSDEAVADLAAHDAGGRPGPRLRARLRDAGGNPLLVREFVRAAAAVGALVADGADVELTDPAGELRIDLPAGIAARLTALSGAAREVLHVAAVLGPCAVDWLGPLLECPSPALRRAVGEATEAGFLDPRSAMVTFRHELLREAFAARVPPAAQAALHRCLGRFLAAADAPSGLVARHLELGSPVPDAETIRWMRRAAADAAVLDPGAAAELLGRAAAAMPIEAPERAEVLAQRARALAALGRPAEARACAGDALAHPVGATTRTALREVLAEASLLEGRPDDAVAEIEHALAACAPDDERAHARLRAQAATVRLWAYDLERAAADADAATELGARIGDPVAMSRALSVGCRVAAFRLNLPEAVRLGDLAVTRAANVPAAVRAAPHLYLGLALANADQWDRARRVLEEGCARGEALGATWALPRYQGALAVLSFFTGAWDDAIHARETGRIIAEDTGCRAGQAQIDAVVGLIAHHRGNDEAAAAAARDAAAATLEPGADQTARPYLGWLQALRAAAQGDTVSAVARLEEACERALRLDVPLVTLWLAPDLARLAIAAERRETAEWIAGEIEQLAPIAGTGTAHAVARYCRGVVEQDVGSLLAAADALEAAGRPLFAARALDSAGDAARTAGRPDTSVQALRRAADIYARLGAAREERATRGQLRALGARTGARGARGRPSTGWSSLTPAEQAVASLVAAGFANGEIASRLYISKRTVESHISRLYVKLQVSTRVGIANAGRYAGGPVPA